MTHYYKLSGFLFAFLILACNSQNAGWTQFENEYFSIEHPDNWQVEVKDSGAIEMTNNQGSLAILWPLYMPETNLEARTQNLLQTMADRLFSDVGWRPVESLDSNHWRILGEKGNNRYLVSTTYASGKYGSLTYLFGIKAPFDRYGDLTEDFARSFASFRIKSEPDDFTPENPAENYSYVTFNDPNENAFSVALPQSWHSAGGLHRVSPIDTRSYIQLSSPDQEIHIFMGDKNLPYFAVPNQTLSWSGFHEGSWYSPGYGSRLLVRRYQPGVMFAEDHSAQLVAANSGFQITASNNRPDMVQRIGGIQQSYGMGLNQRMDAGDVFYKFQNTEETYLGYTFALTSQISGYGTAQWHVDYLYGYQAPSTRVDEAEMVLTRLINSVKINSQWVRMQQNIAGNVSSIVSETNQYISEVIHQTFENTQRTQDEVFRKYSNNLRGVEDVRDPATNQSYKVQSGKNYYWVDNLGNITGTNLYDNPDPNRFREMIRLD